MRKSQFFHFGKEDLNLNKATSTFSSEENTSIRYAHDPLSVDSSEFCLVHSPTEDLLRATKTPSQLVIRNGFHCRWALALLPYPRNRWLVYPFLVSCTGILATDENTPFPCTRREVETEWDLQLHHKLGAFAESCFFLAVLVKLCLSLWFTAQPVESLLISGKYEKKADLSNQRSFLPFIAIINPRLGREGARESCRYNGWAAFHKEQDIEMRPWRAIHFTGYWSNYRVIYGCFYEQRAGQPNCALALLTFGFANNHKIRKPKRPAHQARARRSDRFGAFKWNFWACLLTIIS